MYYYIIIGIIFKINVGKKKLLHLSVIFVTSWTSYYYSVDIVMKNCIDHANHRSNLFYWNGLFIGFNIYINNFYG